MITTLICAKHGAEALAITLGSLVPAVTEGLIGDAVVMTSLRDEGVAAVAEAAGATLIVTADEPWRHGIRLAKRDWVLCLEDGDVPGEGWIRILDRFVTQDAPSRRYGRLTRRPRTWREAVEQRLGRWLGSRTVESGDLIHRSLWAKPTEGGAPARIAARIERDPALG